MMNKLTLSALAFFAAQFSAAGAAAKKPDGMPKLVPSALQLQGGPCSPSAVSFYPSTKRTQWSCGGV